METLSRMSEDAQQQRRPRPYLFWVATCDDLREPPARICLGHFDIIRIGRSPERSFETADEPGRSVLRVGIPDPRLSSEHATIERGVGFWRLSDQASKNGSLVNGTPVSRHQLEDGDVIELGHSFLLFAAAIPSAQAAAVYEPHTEPPLLPGLPTLSPSLAENLEALGRIASTDHAVLVLGETGTGKEVTARAIHVASGRSGRFVPVNCGALPETLVEAELFGAKKGAFSGARADREGYVQAADGGTLFLDEIGDLSLPSQVALLRALQEKEVVPLGSTRPVPVDFRLACATHRDLAALVASERFREDLYARISAHVIELPPLRRRLCDLGLLMSTITAASSTTFEAMRAALCYHWPRNIRELVTAVEVAASVAGGNPITASDLRLPEASAGQTAIAAPDISDDDALRRTLMDLLTAHGGNVSRVADALGKGRTQINRWLKRLDLSADDYRR